jgi:hypothetical protein
MMIFVHPSLYILAKKHITIYRVAVHPYSLTEMKFRKLMLKYVPNLNVLEPFSRGVLDI